MYRVFIALIFQSYHSPNPRIFLPVNMFIQVLAESQHARSMRSGEIDEFRKRNRGKNKSSWLVEHSSHHFPSTCPKVFITTAQEKPKICNIIRSSRRGRGKQEEKEPQQCLICSKTELLLRNNEHILPRDETHHHCYL